MNSVKGEVPLHLEDGRAFTLLFDMEALIEAEGAYGKPMHVMVKDASSGFMGAIRAMLYGALRAYHSETTLSEVSEMLLSNGEAISAALSKAHEASMPSPTASAEGNGKAPRRPGKTSGANGAKPASNRKVSGG